MIFRTLFFIFVMRGRTLANAVVILDEAQNTTSMQMKMFLTRLGENSHMRIKNAKLRRRIVDLVEHIADDK